MAKRDPLPVWLYGIHAADLSDAGPGRVGLTYSDEALARWAGNVPLLSCSLPLRPRRQDASVFCSGLLPEGQHRQAMAAEARLPAYDTFGLLARFGRDVAGAVVIGPDAPDRGSGGVEPYTADALAEEVAALPDRPLGLHDDSELSIAGLQDKLLLIKLDGGWGRPVHGRPSTHILKVEDRRFPGLVQAEAACLALARAVGLTTVDVEVTTIARLPCLIVSRFDRTVDAAGELVRIHQEDACQALGRDPEAGRGRGKYERAGGPAWRDIGELLDRYAPDPEHELRRLVEVLVFTILTANADAHGKNVALLHPEPEAVALAPMYDTVPTALWPQLRKEAAMSVNGKWRFDHMTLSDVVEEARAWRLDPALAEASGAAMLDRVRSAAKRLDIPKAVVSVVDAKCESLGRKRGRS
ncbi:MAG: HipA domain-containing protein [Acidimicrobiia bacterium]|nr:HipA domain-containing protein [Acidimicrobiia bacterium]